MIANLTNGQHAKGRGMGLSERIQQPDRTSSGMTVPGPGSVGAKLLSHFGGGISSPHLVTNVLWFAAFEAAYYAAYRFGMSQALPAPFWFPVSILLCAFLKAPPRYWWIFCLAPLPIVLVISAHQLPLWFLFGMFSVDCTSALLTAVLLRRFMSNPTRFDKIRDLIVFAIAVVAASALSDLGGAELHALRGDDYWHTWQRLLFGDALAQLVLTPAILYWVLQSPLRKSSLILQRRLEACLVFAGLAVTGYFAVHVDAHLFNSSRAVVLYVPVPFLFWAAIRFGMPGASGAVAIITALSLDVALRRNGLFSLGTAAGVSFAVQSGLLFRSVPLYLIAVAIGQERESAGLFRSLAESAPVMIWMSGPDRLCYYFNQRWLDFTGLESRQALGYGWMDAIHPDDLPHCIEQYSAAFDARRPIQADFRLRRHDGEYRWIGDHGVPRYGPDGDFVGYIGSGVDITDRKRAEEDHRALAHAQRLAVVGELTAGVAHEMRQPLAALAIDAETLKMILNGANPQLEPLREIASDMVGNVHRTDDVIKLISTFVRKPETRFEPIAPDALVSDVLQLAGRDATRRGVKVRAKLASGLPAVMGDRTQLQQLLLNLVINAIDAMQTIPEPERLLTLRSAMNAEGGVDISISDSGPGIPPEQVERLFESFFTTKPDGMGLGLSIARSIALVHGGQIHVEANVAGGTTFRVAFPAATEADGIADSASEPNTAVGSVEGMRSSV